MELKIEQVQLPEKISFNYEELKQQLTEKVSMYETLVYDDKQIKDAKADRADLNRLKKALNDERVSREKEYMKPFNEFKDKINEIISIIDKPVVVIDKQIKAYEEKKKQEKRLEIESLFLSMERPDWLKIQQIWNEKWLNATFAMPKIQQEIDNVITSISDSLSMLSDLPEFGFEATEVYRSTLDVNKAIAEGKRLAEIQRRKEEEARKRQREEQIASEYREAMQREAEKEFQSGGTSASSAPADSPAGSAEKAAMAEDRTGRSKETLMCVCLKAWLTVAQARELKEFFNSRNIRFERI